MADTIFVFSVRACAKMYKHFRCVIRCFIRFSSDAFSAVSQVRPKAIITWTPAVRPHHRLTGCSSPCHVSKRGFLGRSPNWCPELSTIPCCWNRIQTGKFTRFPKTSKCAATTSLYPCFGPKWVPLPIQYTPYPFRAEHWNSQPRTDI